MAKFTKLNIGDSVASSGGRVWKKLSAESAVVEDELAGTWVFGDYPTVLSGDAVWYVNFTSNNENHDEITIQERPVGMWMWYNSTEVLTGGSMVDLPSWTSQAYKTITITSKLSEVTNGSVLLTWLKANATKQETSGNSPGSGN